jgi:hypothetical protein
MLGGFPMDSGGNKLPVGKPRRSQKRTAGSLTSPVKAEARIWTDPPNGGGENSLPLIFLSYCHEDAHWREEFSRQLAVAESQDLVKVFFDRRIKGGTRWEPAIRDAISHASVAILLLTPRFLASEFSIERNLNLS